MLGVVDGGEEEVAGACSSRKSRMRGFEGQGRRQSMWREGVSRPGCCLVLSGILIRQVPDTSGSEGSRIVTDAVS